MIKVKDNFKNMYVSDDLFCSLNCGKYEDQQHLLECLILKSTCTDILHNENSKYEDLYSDNTTKQIAVIKLIGNAMRKREEIITRRKQ